MECVIRSLHKVAAARTLGRAHVIFVGVVIAALVAVLMVIPHSPTNPR